MSADQFQRLEAIFVGASALPPGERETYLDRACNGDGGLRAEVEALLQFDDRPVPMLARAAPGSQARLHALEVIDESADDSLPEQIGRYRIIRRLGAGGMGVVYLAEQESPRRTVALKVMRHALASPGMIRRFEMEAHLLGRLQHPNIAQIFEAGVHLEPGEGRRSRLPQPFFAMEHVDGRSLSDFARDEQLGTRSKLELIAKVCDAVHHAHQQGVIHRDLKPHNVLVTPAGEPKVLDFGIARATDSDVQSTSVQTDIGQLIGTIPYMSPEQVAGDPAQVDVRSDVYALGVVCYELLTGRLPLDLGKCSVPEAVRRIGEVDPPRLSSIHPALRGDLDTIVGKAIDKDKLRRYQSASELAADIRRYLADEPVTARPATAMYQFRKFARRNRGLVAAATIAAAALVSGAALAGWQAWRATAAAALAETRREEATDAQAASDANAREADRTVEFLQEMLAAADPDFAAGRQVTVNELLDAAANRVDAELSDHPDVAASVHRTLGRTYQSLGSLSKAEVHLKRALELRQAVHGESSGPVAQSCSDLADLYKIQDRFDSADQLLDRALAICRAHYGDDDLRTVKAIMERALMREARGSDPEAEPAILSALALLEQHVGSDDTDIATCLSSLGFTRLRRQDYAGAEPALRRALDIRRRRLGPDHSATAVSMRDMGMVLAGLGQYEEAEAIIRESLDTFRRLLPPEHPVFGPVLASLANVVRSRGRPEEAIIIFEQSLQVSRANHGNLHSDIALSLNNLGTTHALINDFAASERCYREALDIFRAIYGEEHINVSMGLYNVGKALRNQKKFAESIPYFEDCLAMRRRIMDPTHAYFRTTMVDLAGSLRDVGEVARAEALLREALPLHVTHEPAGAWRTGLVKSRLGEAIALQGGFEEAEPLLLDGLTIIEAENGPDHRRTHEAIGRVVAMYEAWSKPAQAQPYRDRLPADNASAAP